VTVRLLPFPPLQPCDMMVEVGQVSIRCTVTLIIIRAEALADTPQNVASPFRAASTDATQAVVIEPNAFRPPAPRSCGAAGRPYHRC
jgi:hypothetical protein